MYHSLDMIFEEAPASSCNDEFCNGESKLIASWWGGSDIIILIGGAGLRNLVIVGMMEHLQSGQVEFDCSQWCMQSMWNTCLQYGICSNSSFTSNSPKQTQHLFQHFLATYWLASLQSFIFITQQSYSRSYHIKSIEVKDWILGFFKQKKRAHHVDSKLIRPSKVLYVSHTAKTLGLKLCLLGFTE